MLIRTGICNFLFSEILCFCKCLFWFILVHVACFPLPLPKVRWCPFWTQFTSITDISKRISCTDGVNHLANITLMYHRSTGGYVTVFFQAGRERPLNLDRRHDSIMATSDDAVEARWQSFDTNPVFFFKQSPQAEDVGRHVFAVSLLLFQTAQPASHR